MFFVCTVNDIIQFIDLILQKNDVSLFKRIQHSINKLLCHTSIGASKKKDTVLSIFIHLNNCMSAWSRDLSDELCIHPIFLTNFEKRFPALSDQTGMIYRNPGLCQCNRLVQAFTTTKDLPAF